MGCLSLLFCGESTDLSETQYTYFPLSAIKKSMDIDNHAPLPPFANRTVAEPEHEEALLRTIQQAAYDDSGAPELSDLTETLHVHARTDAERRVQIRKTQTHELPSGFSAQVGNWADSFSSPPAPAPHSHIDQACAIPQTAGIRFIPPEPYNVLKIEDEREGHDPRRVRGPRSPPPPPLPSAPQMCNDYHTEGTLGEQPCHREGHGDGLKPSLSSSSSTRKALCKLRTSSAVCPLEGTTAKSEGRNVNGASVAIRECRAGDQLGRSRAMRGRQRPGAPRHGLGDV